MRGGLRRVGYWARIHDRSTVLGDRPWDEDVRLGFWKRGEMYLHNILGDLNHWVTGWTDWNIALDMEVKLINTKIYIL